MSLDGQNKQLQPEKDMVTMDSDIPRNEDLGHAIGSAIETIEELEEDKGI